MSVRCTVGKRCKATVGYDHDADGSGDVQGINTKHLFPWFLQGPSGYPTVGGPPIMGRQGASIPRLSRRFGAALMEKRQRCLHRMEFVYYGIRTHRQCRLRCCGIGRAPRSAEIDNVVGESLAV